MAESQLPVEEGGSIPTYSLRKSEWEVDTCSLKIAQELVRRFHYSHGGSNTRVVTCGLWRRGVREESECYGAAWYLPPTRTAAKSVCKDNPGGVLSLSRLVCIPEAPKNSASFLIRHSMRFIDRRRWPVLLTYADTWQGHGGGIYKALKDAGWIESGLTKPEKTYVKDGVMICRKSCNKTRTHEEMLALGCEFMGSFRRVRFVNSKEK
jgi:hypothetical protein